jgi:hypothetical protein
MSDGGSYGGFAEVQVVRKRDSQYYRLYARKCTQMPRFCRNVPSCINHSAPKLTLDGETNDSDHSDVTATSTSASVSSRNERGSFVHYQISPFLFPSSLLSCRQAVGRSRIEF